MYYTLEPGQYPDKKPENTEDEFFGDSWSVKREDGRYWLSYISGELAGRLISIEITEHDYFAMRDGQIGIDEMCIKYNVL